ncbi:mCG148013 [Mus musculus]|nr:mCG148013 [Mus musculus]
MEERKLTKVQTVRDASAEMLTLVSTAKYTSRSPQPLKVGHILHEWTPPPNIHGKWSRSFHFWPQNYSQVPEPAGVYSFPFSPY